MDRRHPLRNLENSITDDLWLQIAQAVHRHPTLTQERAARILQGIDEAFRRDEAEQAGVPFVPREPQWWPDETGRYLFKPKQIVFG